MNSIYCVVPSIRPESMQRFREEWERLFLKHNVKLVVVWDGEIPSVEVVGSPSFTAGSNLPSDVHGIFCRFTDACRNYGFVEVARTDATHIMTLDDDVYPLPGSDPIQEHLDVLEKRVPISWMNTADGDSPFLRGFPYSLKEEAPVMLSHGVWYNVPDFDGETQLLVTENGTKPEKLPYALPYYQGPIPKGVQMPICGMNLMFRREALPYVYFAPMGVDSGFPDLHRFADIWMGIRLKIMFDRQGWAVYSGAAPIKHSRASDAHKNFKNEKLGRKWNEWAWLGYPDLPAEAREDADYIAYCRSYNDKSNRYFDLVKGLLVK